MVSFLQRLQSSRKTSLFLSQLISERHAMVQMMKVRDKVTFFPAEPGSPMVPSPPIHLQSKQQQVLSAMLILGAGREN